MLPDELDEVIARAICRESHIPYGCGWDEEEIKDFVDEHWRMYLPEAHATCVVYEHTIAKPPIRATLMTQKEARKILSIIYQLAMISYPYGPDSLLLDARIPFAFGEIAEIAAKALTETKDDDQEG